MPLGRPGVSPRNGAGAVLGLMPWICWAEASAPKESSPLAKRVLRLIFFRGFKERGEGCKPIFYDWQAGTFCFFLRLFHLHDVLSDTGVSGSVAREVDN